MNILNPIKRIIAIVLLALAMFKGGGELWFHDAEHAGYQTVTASSFHHYDGDGDAHLVQFCNCSDNFFLSFDVAPFILFLPAVLGSFILFFESLLARLAKLPFQFFSLRAPPTC